MMCLFQGTKAIGDRGRPFRSIATPLAQRYRKPYGAAMSNRAPLHLFEIVFYSTAALLAASGVVWILLH
jgi:hypothetical protein